MLTINTVNRLVMKHFHKPNDEKRSIAVTNENDYAQWLGANHNDAKELLKLSPNDFSISEPLPR